MNIFKNFALSFFLTSSALASENQSGFFRCRVDFACKWKRTYVESLSKWEECKTVRCNPAKLGAQNLKLLERTYCDYQGGHVLMECTAHYNTNSRADGTAATESEAKEFALKQAKCANGTQLLVGSPVCIAQ